MTSVVEQPPCYVQAWAKVTGQKVIRGCPNHGKRWPCVGAKGGQHTDNCWDRWCEDRPEPAWLNELPRHSSDAWLAGMTKTLLANQQHHVQFTAMANGHFAAIIFDADSDMDDPNVDGSGSASTLHAALCRAVLPEGVHTC